MTINNLKIPVWLISIAIFTFAILLVISFVTDRRISWNPFGFLPSEQPHVFASGIHMLESKNLKRLWQYKHGEPSTYDFTGLVPTSANGVMLKVIVQSEGSRTGSFLCGDKNGKFNADLAHFMGNGITNYSDQWTGSTVFCPLKSNRTMEWLTLDNDGKNNTVSTIATLVGWF